MKPGRDLRQGLLVWGVALLLAWRMPGLAWRLGPAPSFPWAGLLPFAVLLLGLILLAPLLACLWGPAAARARTLALWDAPPALLWGSAGLMLWPAGWGPPGRMAWGAAFLMAALPGEVRWIAQALPAEHPFPAAWGAAALGSSRRLSMRALVPRWIAARLLPWITATLVLERMLGVRALGSDWGGTQCAVLADSDAGAYLGCAKEA